MKIKVLVVAILLILGAGCSSIIVPQTPDFYPNEQFTKAGTSGADRAAQECMDLADKYIPQQEWYCLVCKETLVGGVVGAGTGAIGGTIMQAKVGRATGAGAAIGAIVGLLDGLYHINDRPPSYERFVEHCLQKKGYEVIGWSSKQ